MRGFILILFVLVSGCKAQEKETFWKTGDVTKIDGSAMTGITLAYMEAIAGMNIHVSKNQDSLAFHFPYEKTVKINELKSLTGYRVEDSGKLLDSIYDIVIEDETLKLKFHYRGTGKDDNRFSLNLVLLDKTDFLAQAAKLKKERNQLMDKVKPIGISRFDLSIFKPDYFNDKDLMALSPMQGVEEFLGVKSDTIQPIFRTFDYRSGETESTYYHVGVKTSAQGRPYMATFGDIHFSELEFIVQEKNDKTEAIILAQDALEKKLIKKVFDAVSTDMSQAKIACEGLPERLSDGTILGIGPSMALTWSGKDRTVKLLIDEIPDELYDAESNDDIAVSIMDKTNGNVIKKVFLHYLGLVDKSGIRIFIVSPGFDAVLRSDDYSGDAQGNIVDYYSGN